MSPSLEVSDSQPVAVATNAVQTCLEFTGTGSEYFRIWVVHALLTLLTLGIYSPWAKVRKARWFAQHTRLFGDVFDYHGPPGRILQGRAIALALLLAYSWSFQWSTTAGLTVVGMLLLVGPLLYGAAQRFRLANTSWRGLRFGFDGSSRAVYAVGIPVLLVWMSGSVWTAIHGSPEGLLAIGTASLLTWPAIHSALKATQHRLTRFGEERFAFRRSLSAFYLLYLPTAGIIVLAMIVAGFVVALTRGAVPSTNASVAGPWVIAVIVVVSYIVAGAYFIARLQRAVWSRTGLGAIEFGSAMRARTMLWLLLRHLGATVLTLGIYWPFAAVAIARYRLESITLQSTGPMPEIAGRPAGRASSVGDAAFDLFGLDLGW